jgi:hypothetical protein
VFASTWVVGDGGEGSPEDGPGFAVVFVLRAEMVETEWDDRDGYPTGAPPRRVPIALAAGNSKELTRDPRARPNCYE